MREYLHCLIKRYITARANRNRNCQLSRYSPDLWHQSGYRLTLGLYYREIYVALFLSLSSCSDTPCGFHFAPWHHSPRHTRGYGNTRLYTDNGITPQFSSSWPQTPRGSTVSLRPRRRKENRLPSYSCPLLLQPTPIILFVSVPAQVPITQYVNLHSIGLFPRKYETAYHKFDFWHEMCA